MKGTQTMTTDARSTKAGLKIKLTTIYVNDQDKALRFYTDVLGFVKKDDFTNGPYRWLKHPAYVAKNINWWLIYLPFLSSIGFTEGIRLSALLVGVNTIYYLRAKTEEAHLSVDPIYQQYLEFMRNNGLFARARHIFVRRVQAFSQSQ